MNANYRNNVSLVNNVTNVTTNKGVGFYLNLEKAEKYEVSLNGEYSYEMPKTTWVHFRRSPIIHITLEVR